MNETISPARALAPKAVSRSWREPAVRGLLIGAAMMFVVAGWLFVEQFQAARHGRYRIDHWRKVDANLHKLFNTTRTTFRPTLYELPTLDAYLTYPLPDGKPQDVEGKLEAQSAPRSPGDTIPILVDPADPTRWTDRVHPLPLFEQLIAPLLIVPLPLILAGAALWKRRRILRLWQTGLLRRGFVVSRANSPISPGSMIVRCTVEGNREKRIVSVAVPRAIARFEPGDTLMLVVPSADSTRAIAAMLYE